MVMETYFEFGSIPVSDTALSNAAKAALKAIERELPSKARTRAVYDFVLNECREILDMVELKLE